MDSPSIGQLTEEDLPEVFHHFIQMGKADPQWDLKIKTNAMNELLVATCGQLYPLLSSPNTCWT
jgi:hypothetical protein